MDIEQDLNEIRAELKNISKVTAENKAMLRLLYRNARLVTFFTVIKWLIILIVAIGSFYYIQPFLVQIEKTYQTITGGRIDVMGILEKLK